MDVVFSGVQPTGKMHIGNYLGAISLWVRNQHRYRNFFCIVDLHALTIPENIDPRALRQNSFDVAALYIACGIDPKQSVIFIQSQVKQHTELAWLLNCVTPMGWMNRMTQFKVKSKSAETIGVGLYDYPVLQASDILLYQTNLVPVGEDQRQHIEITQDIAQRFGNLFGEVFTIPQVLVQEVGARIMGLDDPTAKMSKSSKNDKHAINLLDDENTILKKVRSAKTDSQIAVDVTNMSPGVRNLVDIYHAFEGGDYHATLRHFDGASYGRLKTEVGERVAAGLAPIQEHYRFLRNDQSALEAIVNSSAEMAREVAETTMVRVRKAIGTF
jgi:tryptophanyl-tRNA synthetase